MTNHDLTFAVLAASNKLTQKLDRSLSGIKGISFSEYQLLSALCLHPGGSLTRVELASAVGLSPSGVTRALKPLEKLGFVATVKDGRDARRALAKLTDAGVELVADAEGVVGDLVDRLELTPLPDAHADQLLGFLQELANA